jgi:hypothetical protein
MKGLKDILLSNNVTFDDSGKINIPTNIKKIKFDIGIATEAIHTEYWLNHDPDDLLVFGFEPLPLAVDETIKYFKQTKSKWAHISPNKIDMKWLNNQFFVVPIALGDVIMGGEYMDFYVTTANNVGCSSLYKPSNLLKTQHDIELDHVIKVPVFNLSDFFELLPLDKFEYIEYIKVDVQGNDLNIIKSGGKYIQDKVVFVTMEPEVGQYIGADNNSVSNMISYMNNIGFDHIHHPNTSDPTFVNRKFRHIANNIHIHQFN